MEVAAFKPVHCQSLTSCCHLKRILLNYSI